MAEIKTNRKSASRRSRRGSPLLLIVLLLLVAALALVCWLLISHQLLDTAAEGIAPAGNQSQTASVSSASSPQTVETTAEPTATPEPTPTPAPTEEPGFPLFGERYIGTEQSVSLAGRQDLGEADVQALTAVADEIFWEDLDLTDTSFTQEEKMAIADALPNTRVLWSFDWCGVPVTTADEQVDLSNIPMENTEAVESMLPYMFNLNRVEMCDCGIPYEDMNALNKRYEDIRFVWMIRFSHYSFKTDIRGFRGTTEHYGVIDNTTCWYFTYCEDLICLDIGHRAPSSLEFLAEMPQLVYLMINGNFTLTDITPVGTLKNLRWLEMFMCYGVTDLSPLLGCTSLSDLNIIVAGTNYPDANFEVLKQMTWLDRLWFSNAQLTVEQEEQLHEINPKLITWRGYGKNDSTAGSWRADLDYYEMRDILFPGDLQWYMGPFGGNIPFRVIDGVRYDKVDGEWVALGKDPNEGVDWNAHMG